MTYQCYKAYKKTYDIFNRIKIGDILIDKSLKCLHETSKYLVLSKNDYDLSINVLGSKSFKKYTVRLANDRLSDFALLYVESDF